MTVIDVLNKFQNEYLIAEVEINQLFAQTNVKAPILHNEHYLLAEKINQIPGFEDIVEALSTFESPHVINPQTWLRIWLTVSSSLSQLIPGFNADLSMHLKQLFQALCQQYADRKFTSSVWITKSIKDLQPDESFQLLLPQTTVWGRSLENLAVYKKNDNGTYDIQLFQAKQDCWSEQGGEHAVGHEKAFPVRYFSQVPVENLLGPEFKAQSIYPRRGIIKSDGRFQPCRKCAYCSLCAFERIFNRTLPACAYG